MGSNTEELAKSTINGMGPEIKFSSKTTPSTPLSSIASPPISSDTPVARQGEGEVTVVLSPLEQRTNNVESIDVKSDG